MRAAVIENQHAWAQTIANSMATLVAIVAIFFAVESDRNNLENDKEARVNEVWLSYLEQQANTYDALEFLREQGSNPVVTWQSNLEIRNLLARLEYIHTSSESKLWQARVEDQLKLYNTWLCVEPRLSITKDTSSTKFQHLIADICTPRTAR
jgi:hypothetical protein